MTPEEQADLTKAERERDAALDARDFHRHATHAALADVERVARTLDFVRAELASARQEIAQLRAARQWIVARDGGRWCERCGAEIRRGEAYQLEPGTGGLVTHIHCPDQGGTDG